MKNVMLKIDGVVGGPDTDVKTELNAIFDQEVEEFSTWMANIPDVRARGPLMNGEKALLKTYLIQKLKGAL